MKSKYSFYFVIKKIHLYASLCVVTLLIMYLTTSFMMIYHDYFKVEKQERIVSIGVSQDELSKENWNLFLKKHNIKGRLVQEYFEDSGNLIRKYEKVGNTYKITLLKNKDSVLIKSTQLNFSGKLIGLHRMRGYGGNLKYNIYAVLIDLTGVSLIIFAITGIIMWLKLLKHNKIAWIVFISGFVYVSLIISYLIFI